MMTFKIHEQMENDAGELTNEYKVYERTFKSLTELIDTIDSEWWWAKVEISTTFGNDIWLRYDESNESEAWNE